ncbi:hypothetical protein ABES02_11695 [Neobacillus pocheonensis]
MKKVVVLLFSLALLVPVVSAKGVEVQRSSNNVAIELPSEHPIQPPIG